MKTLADRLDVAVSQTPVRIRKSELARVAGVKPPSVSDWFNGRTKMLDGDHLLKVAAYLNVRPEWLATGRLPMRADGANASTASSLLPDTDYLRLQHLDAEAGMGGGRLNPDHPDVIGELSMARDYIRQIVGFIPRPGRLVLLTGRGDSMLPTIQPGDVLIVDTGITAYDYDGLYLINLGNGQQVKRLVDRGAALYVCSDNPNPAYAPFPLPEGAIIGGRVYLRTRLERLT